MHNPISFSKSFSANDSHPNHLFFRVFLSMGSKSSAIKSGKLVALVIALCSGACTQTEVGGRNLAMTTSNWSAQADLWIMNHQEDSGLFPYFFNPELDQSIREQNLNGQLITGHRLALAAKSRPRLRSAQERHALAIHQEWNETSIKSLGSSISSIGSLGTQALFLRMRLSEARLADHLGKDLSELERRIATLSHSLKQAWNSETGFSDYKETSAKESEFNRRFYTPIVALALTEHSHYSKDETSLSVAISAIDWLESSYPSNDERFFNPSHTPWYVEALFKLNSLSPKRELVERIFLLSDQLLKLQATREFPGRFWSESSPDYGSPNTLRDAQSTRVLLMALELAVESDDEARIRRYRSGARLALDNLRAHQYNLGSVEAFPNPSSAIGAVRFRYNTPIIRLDSVVFSAIAFEHASELAWTNIL